ncbi:hypothetical protein J7394_20980 [Ruegeria sp. R13_0]|uniref:hypothetical protein n=1 Tax=Ruegeria sp. R13_0 TaxID=2821099 RepID=UPI001ADA242A|nr:hypothetical protein [Ruegeria sp. R13_0]MBO9436692.1 hypothetical protein [Ruegeria sp. R13_0]
MSNSIESDTDKINDLHIWQVGPGYYSAVISVASTDPRSPGEYKSLLGGIDLVARTTVEVNKIVAAT